jgi:hypothetical protein
MGSAGVSISGFSDMVQDVIVQDVILGDGDGRAL